MIEDYLRELRASLFPPAAAVFFVAAMPVVLTVFAVNGRPVGPQGGAFVLAMAGLALLYSARMAGILVWQRRTS